MVKVSIAVSNKDELLIANQLIKEHPDMINKTVIKSGAFLIEAKMNSLKVNSFEPLLTSLMNPDGVITFFFKNDRLHIKNGRTIKMVDKKNKNLIQTYYDTVSKENIPDYIIIMGIFGDDISNTEMTNMTSSMPDAVFNNVNQAFLDILKKLVVNDSKPKSRKVGNTYKKTLATLKKSMSVGKYTVVILEQ